MTAHVRQLYSDDLRRAQASARIIIARARGRIDDEVIHAAEFLAKYPADLSDVDLSSMAIMAASDAGVDEINRRSDFRWSATKAAFIILSFVVGLISLAIFVAAKVAEAFLPQLVGVVL